MSYVFVHLPFNLFSFPFLLLRLDIQSYWLLFTLLFVSQLWPRNKDSLFRSFVPGLKQIARLLSFPIQSFAVHYLSLDFENGQSMQFFLQVYPKLTYKYILSARR